MNKITAVDHTGRKHTYRSGDKVRVFVDTNGGFHPSVNGSKGVYEDTVRNGFIQHDTLGNKFPAVILTIHSWVPVSEIEPA